MPTAVYDVLCAILEAGRGPVTRGTLLAYSTRIRQEPSMGTSRASTASPACTVKFLQPVEKLMTKTRQEGRASTADAFIWAVRRAETFGTGGSALERSPS